MVLKGQSKGKDGKMTMQRITWTPMNDGRVSQHLEVSNDDGKTASWGTILKLNKLRLGKD
jgi:hypothetical protein